MLLRDVRNTYIGKYSAGGSPARAGSDGKWAAHVGVLWGSGHEKDGSRPVSLAGGGRRKLWVAQRAGEYSCRCNPQYDVLS